MESIAARWKSRLEAVRATFELADTGFLLLRVIVLAGTVAWLALAPIPPATVRTFLWIAVFFVSYGLLLYAFLWVRFEEKRDLYGLSLLFDLAFLHLLIVHSGGFESSFFIGFYLLTALHAFYFGPRRGIAVALACGAVYLLAATRVSPPDPYDFLLRASFLLLIAVPIGFLSGKLRGDKQRIEALNADLRQSIEAMRLLQGKLVEAEKLSALGRLTADVAHEIRNPLTVVGGFAKRLEKRLPEDTTERRYARILVSEVDRLERILRDTLSFSREARYHLRYADVGELVLRYATELSEACREKGIRLESRIAKDLPSCIVDVDQIRQALHNLASNAIDAMGAGGTLALAARTECENGVHYVVVDVVDTGPGIPPELVGRIFEPFYTTKETGYGTGLGLSICKKIMEEHRGVVRVRSTPGEGSAFSLLLPYLPPEETFQAQCWEVMRCGMDRRENAGEACPAYPNFGRICWSVAGTFSETAIRCGASLQIGDCRKCPFFEMVQPACP